MWLFCFSQTVPLAFPFLPCGMYRGGKLKMIDGGYSGMTFMGNL